MEQSATHVEKLLTTLRSGSFFERRKAADDLSQLPISTKEITDALVHSAQNDSDPSVRRAALKAAETLVQRQPTLPQLSLTNTLASIKRRQQSEDYAAQQTTESKGGGGGIWQVIGVVLSAIGSMIEVLSNKDESTRAVCFGAIVLGGIIMLIAVFASASSSSS